jgi:hypothetical protein
LGHFAESWDILLKVPMIFFAESFAESWDILLKVATSGSLATVILYLRLFSKIGKCSPACRASARKQFSRTLQQRPLKIVLAMHVPHYSNVMTSQP